MSSESNQRQQPDGRGASMIGREPLKRAPNPRRQREQAGLRHHEARSDHVLTLAALPLALEQRTVGLHGPAYGESRLECVGACHAIYTKRNANSGRARDQIRPQSLGSV